MCSSDLEQIDWKQRFFVPTDEESGIATLTELLGRYPVMLSDALADEEPIAEIEPTELAPPQIVNLDVWFVPVAEAEQSTEPPPLPSKQAQEVETAESGWTLPAFYFARSPRAAREVEEMQLALDFG